MVYQNIMPSQTMIEANNNIELSDDYFYDEFSSECSFLKINEDDTNELNYCLNQESGEEYCSHRSCPFWNGRD